MAGKRPDLIPEWDDNANLPRTPYSIKATYAKTIVWKCADPRHDPYRASPRPRTKVASHEPYCPYCRKMDHTKVVKRTGFSAADEELF